MGRKRNLDNFPERFRHLPIPAQVYWRDEQFVLDDQRCEFAPKRKSYYLGADYGAMVRRVNEMIAGVGELSTMTQVFRRFIREVLPLKRPKTQKTYRYAIDGFLEPAFGAMRPDDVTAYLVKQYREARAPLRDDYDPELHTHPRLNARQTDYETAILSSVLSVLIDEWDYPIAHPFKGRRGFKFNLPSRNNYVEDWQYSAVYADADEVTQIRMELHAMLALGSTDIVYIRREHLRREGLVFSRKKTAGAPVPKGYRPRGARAPNCYVWTDELRATLTRALARQQRLGLQSEWLLCARSGNRYTEDGFNTLWTKAVKRALERGSLPDDAVFRPHDLRAKAGTDAENIIAFPGSGPELLQHSNTQVFEQHYRRQPKRVEPVPLPSNRRPAAPWTDDEMQAFLADNDGVQGRESKF